MKASPAWMSLAGHRLLLAAESGEAHTDKLFWLPSPIYPQLHAFVSNKAALRPWEARRSRRVFVTVASVLDSSRPRGSGVLP